MIANSDRPSPSDADLVRGKRLDGCISVEGRSVKEMLPSGTPLEL